MPKAADTGETYGTTVLPVSSGPYKVDSYTTGNGGKMLLSRNENWKQESDPYRTPYPDKWEVDFGIDPKVLDQRIMQSSGNDAYAVQYGNVRAREPVRHLQGPPDAEPRLRRSRRQRLRPVRPLLLDQRQQGQERQDPSGHGRRPRPERDPPERRRRLRR